jgi:hypothetical protein
VCSAKSGTEGSNPSLSARRFLWTQTNADFQDKRLKKCRKASLEGLFQRFWPYLC